MSHGKSQRPLTDSQQVAMSAIDHLGTPSPDALWRYLERSDQTLLFPGLKKSLDATLDG